MNIAFVPRKNISLGTRYFLAQDSNVNADVGYKFEHFLHVGVTTLQAFLRVLDLDVQPKDKEHRRIAQHVAYRREN